MKKNLKIIIFLGLIVIIAGLVWQLSAQPKTKNETIEQVTGQEQGQLSVTFNFADDQKTNLVYPYADTLTTDLSTITESMAAKQNWAFEYKDYGEMGKMITKINNKTNGQDNKYWQYYVNGALSQIGASQYVPKSGDKIEWRFEVSKY